MTRYERLYPDLHRPARWAWGGIDATFSTALPSDDLVTNVHVVGFTEDRVVICRVMHNIWFVPGGTREAGETIDACARRELLEEAGAILTGPLTWFGAHDCVSDQPEPFKPSQPHPRKAWLWCHADVELVSDPTNPHGGEQVAEIRAAPIDEACELLRAGSIEFGGNEALPDVVRIAVDLRSRS